MAQSSAAGCFLRLCSIFCKSSAKWHLASNDRISLGGCPERKKKKRGGEKNKTMTFSGLQENRESLESTGEQFQWKCREELIESYWGRKDSLLIGSYMNEKRFHEAGGVWQATGCFRVRARKR